MRIADVGRHTCPVTARKVAVVGCRRFPTLDADWPLLQAALADLGVVAELVHWDDPEVVWSDFDFVVVRGTWDSTVRPCEFLAWANQVASVTVLANGTDMFDWNLDKRYLRDLHESGVSEVPTDWVEPGRVWEPPPGEFVVKPSISGGGIEAARYGPAHAIDATEHVQRLLGKGRTVMVQDYVSAVDVEGELAVVILGGQFSHAVLKGPLLQLGAGVSDALWEREVLTLSAATSAQMGIALRALSVAADRFDRMPLYARVDLVTGPGREPMVLEMELIDPSLFLELAPGSAERFAEVIASDLRTDCHQTRR